MLRQAVWVSPRVCVTRLVPRRGDAAFHTMHFCKKTRHSSATQARPLVQVAARGGAERGCGAPTLPRTTYDSSPPSPCSC